MAILQTLSLKVFNIQYKALLYKMKKLEIGESPVLARQPAFRISRRMRE
jgi:hypothetical protein